jgi:hypothetical protein
MGAVEVLLEKMDEIPRERNAKFRSVICHLSDEEKNYLQKLEEASVAQTLAVNHRQHSSENSVRDE